MAKQRKNVNDSDPIKKKKKPMQGLYIALIVICVLLSLVLVAETTFIVWVEYSLNQINYSDNSETISQEDAASIAADEYEDIDPNNNDPLFNQEDLTFEENVVHQGQGSHIVNIMLVGQDAREGEGRQRSDSMMLVTFNKKQGTITLTSFMRDQYVQIPGYGATKLCHAYAYGGMDLLNQTLYNHYGIEIDGNLEVNFSGFENIIDYLGGVDINLTKAEVKYLKEAGYGYVKEGKCRLDGETALLYSRLRSIDTDYNRAERQRNVMMSLIEEYKGLSEFEMLGFLNDLLPYLTTNMTKDEIKQYAVDLLSTFSGAQINTLRIPADGTFTGGYVKVSDYSSKKLWCQLKIDFAANRDLLNEIFE